MKCRTIQYDCRAGRWTPDLRMAVSSGCTLSELMSTEVLELWCIIPTYPKSAVRWHAQCPPFATGTCLLSKFGVTWPATISERAMSTSVSSIERKANPSSLMACARWSKGSQCAARFSEGQHQRAVGFWMQQPIKQHGGIRQGPSLADIDCPRSWHTPWCCPAACLG